jgi:cytochrome c oxidase assembly factor CtaG
MRMKSEAQMKQTIIVLGLAWFLVVALLPAGWLSAPSGGLLSLCLQGVPLHAGSLWSAWSLAPAVVIPLVAWAFGHFVWLSKAGVSGVEVALSACGFVLLGLAVLSPLCRLAGNLASAHMVQHVILVALAPPLLALGMRYVPAGAMRLLAAHPGKCAAAYGILIWLWHVPRFYEAALLDARIHLLMYFSLIAAAMLFWTGIVAAKRAGAAQGIWAIVALLITFVHTGLLGALLLFSPRLWFPLLAGSSASWGLTPLADQQLAGLIMWVPMGAVFLLAALWVAAGALTHAGDARPGAKSS